MKVSTIISSLALGATLVSGQALNVPSVISDFYPTSTPNIPAAASTSLASALHSLDSSWTNNPAFTSFRDAVNSAAPTSVRNSMESSGIIYADITTQDWYVKSVPTAVKTPLIAYESALESAADKIVGTPTSKNGGARETGMAMVGVVGFVGAVVAVL